MMDYGPAGMDRHEVLAFLGERPRYCAMASVRRDGSPFVVPLGYWCDDSYLYMTMGPERGGVKRLRRDPRVSISVHNEDFPARFVCIVGEAEEIPDPGYEISLRVHRRYPKGHVTDERAYERNWLSTGKVVFRVPIERFVGMDLTKITDLAEEGAMTYEERLARQRDRDPQGSGGG